MTAPVPPVDLDQLETALAAATPGPWQRWGNHHVCVESAPVGYCEQSADAAAIVAAVNAAPALIAELRDLRAESEKRLDALIKVRAERDELQGRHARLLNALRALDGGS